MRRLSILAATALLVGCSTLLPSPTPNDYDIRVSNGTTLEVGVQVNGALVATFPPGKVGTLVAGSLGPLPWTILAITASGRVLATMTVTAGAVGCTDLADGSRACRGALGRADLSCGRFDMFAAGTLFEGPAPGPGVPGDCVP